MKTMKNEKKIKELNGKLDYMLDHLEDYTDNDIISIVDQIDELYPKDSTPPVPIEESLKDFWKFVAEREEEERILSQCLPKNVFNLDDICLFRLYNFFKTISCGKDFIMNRSYYFNFYYKEETNL